MMSEIDTENLRAALAKHGPARVKLYRGEDALREIPVPTGKKRWAAVLAVASKLDWSRAELVDRTGGLLCVVDAQTQDPGVALDVHDLNGREAQLLGILIKAQQSALANRAAETQMALNACTSAVRMLTDAVGALANVQRMTLDVQAQAYQAQIAAAVATTTPEGEAPPPGSELISGQLLQQMAPFIMQRLFGPPPIAAPAQSTPSNGAK